MNSYKVEENVTLTVWRNGRTGHVSRREAGVHYSYKPDPYFGPLAVLNTLHFERAVVAYNPWLLLDPIGYQRVARQMGASGEAVRCAGVLEEKSVSLARLALYYDVDSMIAQWARLEGFDGIIYEGRIFGVVQL